MLECLDPALEGLKSPVTKLVPMGIGDPGCGGGDPDVDGTCPIEGVTRLAGLNGEFGAVVAWRTLEPVERGALVLLSFDELVSVLEALLTGNGRGISAELGGPTDGGETDGAVCDVCTYDAYGETSVGEGYGAVMVLTAVSPVCTWWDDEEVSAW